MNRKPVFALIALAVALAAGTAAPVLAQAKGPQEASKSAKVKAASERFNRNYGKKVPTKKSSRVRVDETKNKVRVFNKEAATGKTTASTASKKRPTRPGNKASNARLAENLRKNETIRHKGDQARVKRNLSKLKGKMSPGELARANKVIEARKAKDAAQAAKAAQAARAAQAAKAAQAARAVQAARAAQASRAALVGGRAALAGARAATASTGLGLALVGASIAAEQIAIQEIEHPGKTARDIGGFFTGLVGTAAVSGPDTSPAHSAIYDTFGIETGRATVRAAPNGQRGYTTIQFSTNLDWWTAIVIRDTSGRVIQVEKVDGRYHLYRNRQNGGSTNTVVIPTGSLPAQVHLEFWTAKTFGVHKQMVIMKYRKERLDGRTVAINWSK